MDSTSSIVPEAVSTPPTEVAAHHPRTTVERAAVPCRFASPPPLPVSNATTIGSEKHLCIGRGLRPIERRLSGSGSLPARSDARYGTCAGLRPHATHTALSQYPWHPSLFTCFIPWIAGLFSPSLTRSLTLLRLLFGSIQLALLCETQDLSASQLLRPLGLSSLRIQLKITSPKLNSAPCTQLTPPATPAAYLGSESGFLSALLCLFDAFGLFLGFSPLRGGTAFVRPLRILFCLGFGGSLRVLVRLLAGTSLTNQPQVRTKRALSWRSCSCRTSTAFGFAFIFFGMLASSCRDHAKELTREARRCENMVAFVTCSERKEGM